MASPKINIRADGWPEIRRRFLESSEEGVRELAKELGYQATDSLYRFMRQHGVEEKRTPNVKVEEHEPTIYPAPPIEIRALAQEGDVAEGAEVHLAPRSDAHVGLLTPSYNTAVFKERLWHLAAAETNILRLHRKMRPIRKLVSPWTGDMVQGEQYGIQGYVEEFECGVEEQIFEHLIPEMTNYYVNLLQYYDEIEIPIVPGNHGNIQRRSQKVSKRSHWDTIAGRMLKSALSLYSDLHQWLILLRL